MDEDDDDLELFDRAPKRCRPMDDDDEEEDDDLDDLDDESPRGKRAKKGGEKQVKARSTRSGKAAPVTVDLGDDEDDEDESSSPPARAKKAVITFDDSDEEEEVSSSSNQRDSLLDACSDAIKATDDAKQDFHASVADEDEEQDGVEVAEGEPQQPAVEVVVDKGNQIKLTFRLSEKRKKTVKMWERDKFQLAIDALCRHFEVQALTLKIDGEVVELDQTPQDYELEDEDVLDVFAKQG